MKIAKLLIDKATKTCGSDAEVARRLGIYPADVSNLRAGKRKLSPEIAAELAELAGEDARQAVIEAVIERNEGTRRGGLLREILGKGLAAGVAGMLLISYSGSVSATSRAANESVRAFNTLQIVFRKKARLMRRKGKHLLAKAARSKRPTRRAALSVV